MVSITGSTIREVLGRALRVTLIVVVAIVLLVVLDRAVASNPLWRRIVVTALAVGVLAGVTRWFVDVWTSTRRSSK
jgi:hypothetical protein